MREEDKGSVSLHLLWKVLVEEKYLLNKFHLREKQHNKASTESRGSQITSTNLFTSFFFFLLCLALSIPPPQFYYRSSSAKITVKHIEEETNLSGSEKHTWQRHRQASLLWDELLYVPDNIPAPQLQRSKGVFQFQKEVPKSLSLCALQKVFSHRIINLCLTRPTAG